MVQVKLVGAAGYGGLGMIELLCRHPHIDLAAIVDIQDAGKPISAVWPYLEGYCDLPIMTPEEAADVAADVTVYATPDGVGQAAAVAEVAAGRRVLDYSGDFRFADQAVYAEYARRLGRDPQHRCPALLERSVYGLPELYRDRIADAQVVGNPGCFAVSCILGLLPAVRERLVERSGLICDSKTGVSGAGKKPAPGFHYPERYDSMNAYRLSGHQHVMEIERELSVGAKTDIAVTFTPQVVPATRGILSCLYGRLAAGATQQRVLEAYRSTYAAEPFVMVRDGTSACATGQVRGGNRCLLQVACDERSGVFRVISHIDNLVKGQAGSAVQNLNIMFGLPEDAGLDLPGAHP